MSKLATKTIKLGDSADTSKNFLISVPATPDGSLTIERENGTDVLTVDASGRVVIPGNVVPAFSATTSAIQYIADNTWSKVSNLSIEVFDTNNCFSSNRFTPTVAGYYQLNAVVNGLASSATLNNVGAAFYVNGGNLTAIANLVASNLSAQQVALSSLTYLNGTTDYVELYGRVSGGGSGQAIGSAHFSGVLVRAA